MISRSIERIHFIAVCGTAMANLAVKMKQLGYQVTGSDENCYPPMSTFLAENQVKVSPTFDEKNLTPHPDLVIIGNAVVRGNPEAEYALEHKLHYVSFPEALREFFLRGKRNIVITGTHGKTTAASLLSWVLQRAHFHPSFFIGGIPENFGFGFQISEGEYFVLEGDEYDSAFFDKRSKFLHYLPEIVVINNLEFDHADIFRDIEDIKQSFRYLLKLIPRNGMIVANHDDSAVQEVVNSGFAPVENFGFGPGAQWRITSIHASEKGVKFRIDHGGKSFGEFTLPLSGRHNILNAAGVIVVCHHLGLDGEHIQAGFHSFKSVRRRLQVCAIVNEITVYDDFAHHPTAIRETLAGLKAQYPGTRIWAVFEPRTNTTRRNVFQQELAAAFSEAFGVAIGKVNRAHLLPPEKRLDRARLCMACRNRNQPAFHHDEVEAIIDWLLPQLQAGDRVVIMSNGEFDNIHEKLLARLRENSTIGPG